MQQPATAPAPTPEQQPTAKVIDFATTVSRHKAAMVRLEKAENGIRECVSPKTLRKQLRDVLDDVRQRELALLDAEDSHA